MTIDSIPIAFIVTNALIPLVNKYNELGGLDWRSRFCENADEMVSEHLLLNQDRMRPLGPHSTPRYVGVNKATYWESVDAYGEAVGYDIEFQKYAKEKDWIDKMVMMTNMDVRNIRYQIIKEMLNPQSPGRGFWNQTFDPLDVITAPPTFGVNTFTGTHTHYNTTGAAALANLDVFADAKQHIREHGNVNGNFDCIMNSSDVTAIEKLASWIGNNRANISNSFTDNQFARGLDGEFTYMGINFITEDWMPAGYFVVLGGTNSSKPFKFHECQNPEYRGLLWLEGKNPGRPWLDSYVRRDFRVRTWNRWQGVVYQISANATYTAPSEYA
jgi:hypothetical protein